jgi:hypothetical protein
VSRSTLLVLSGLGLAAALVAFLVAEPWLAEPGMPVDEAVAGDVAGAITFELDQRNDSGRFGFVTLEPVEEGTRVGIDLGLPGDVPQPAHVHEGTCSRPGKALYGLIVVLARAGPDAPATSFTTLEVPLDELRAGRKVVDVHRSAFDPTVVACAAIGD